MKVRMKTIAAGPDGVLVPDQEYDLPNKLAQALVEGGYAEEVETAPARYRKREKATAGKREKAVAE